MCFNNCLLQELFQCLFCLLILLTPSLSSAFDILPKALTDADIKQYIQAYNNIAKVSPQIKLEKEKITGGKELEEECKKKAPKLANFNRVFCSDLDLLKDIFKTCKPCKVLVTKAVMDAGYKSYNSFLYMDARIHIAMYYYSELQMAKFLGELGIEHTTTDHSTGKPLKKGVNAALFCAQLNESDDNESKIMNQSEKNIQNKVKNSADKDQLEKIYEYCSRMNLFSGYIQKISKTIVKIAEKLLKKGDIAKVEQHYEKIIDALTDEDLDDRYRHVMGRGGFDD